MTEEIKMHFIARQMTFKKNADAPDSEWVIPVEITESEDGIVEIAFDTHEGRVRQYLKFDKADFIKAVKAFDAQ